MIVHNDVQHDSRVLREAASLASAGWRVVVLGISLTAEKFPEKEEVNGFTIIRITPKLFRGWLSGRMGLLLPLIPMFPVMSYRLRQIKARVYHAHDFTGLLQLGLSGMWNQRIVYDSHELFFDRPLTGIPGPIEWAIKQLRPLEKALARRTLASITVGDSIADRLSQTLDIPRPVVVRNTVDLRNMGESGADFEANGRRVMVHTGHLASGRHLPELVHALIYLPDNIMLVLMGQGPLAAELSAIAAEIGVTDRLKFIAPTKPDQVSVTIEQADLALALITDTCLNNSLSLPNKLFEAIAAGLPVVTSANKEIASLVEQYGMGETCNPFDSESIARAAQKILQSDQYMVYRKNAERARETLNWEQEETKLIDLYQRLLNQNDKND